MSYIGKSNVLKSGPYVERIYFDEQDSGNPPPEAPDRFLLLEDGFNLLLESGGKIKLEN